MKPIVLSLALVLAGSIAVPAFQSSTSTDNTSASQDLKNAGSNTKRAVKKGATKSTHAVKKGTHKAAAETEKGASKLKNKTSDTSTHE